ncbi:1-phosphatidylinositol-4,5-bisphosphate phosphodiesterase beta-2 [Gossypium australe]|uniref:1-phosphatidylinositol-4,5-bisphosphate phosphodiesterase beta-2 n=1 Tax=Gossypium australe TaxID=47621 RepID=A0A5B6VTD5_9ROSI|nr:1-phosphatidylinositol-4,5-bisphosphate phosphodiesterase beta-2 [Gossypium australe]
MHKTVNPDKLHFTRSTRGIHGRVTRGYGRGRRGARAGSLTSKNMPNFDTSESLISPATATGSHDHAARDDVLSQAMLQILERVTGPNTRSEGRRSNGAEIFRGVTRVAPNMAEYWMEATERIMGDLDFIVELKLKGTISLLRDEAY